MTDEVRNRHASLAELEVARQRIAELEDAAAHYRELVDKAAESIVVVQDGTLVFYNPSFERMVSVGPQEFSSAPLIDFVHPDDRVKLLERYQQILQADEPSERFEFRTVTPDKVVRWYSVVASPIRWQSRPALLCCLTEISAEKQALRRLQESETKYRLLVESAPAAIYEIDLRRSRFLSVNDLMCQYLGYTRDELLAMDAGNILSDQSRKLMDERLARRMRGKPVSETVEFQVRTKDGRDLWVLLNIGVIREDKGALRAAVVAHDITARRQLEKELHKVQKLESVGVLAGGIAHDFNNLLTAILGTISLARHSSHDADKVEASCDAAAAACKRAQHLTQQLLTFSEGGAPVQKPVAVRPLVHECIGLVVGGSKVRCETELPGDVWSWNVDESQVVQVLSNLILNAAQAMPDGGTVRLTACNVELTGNDELPLPAGRYVQLSIADEGVGIAPELLPRVFDPFFTTKDTGTGLGLSAAYSIVERHGGHLIAESELDQGSTFILYLPAALTDQEQAMGSPAAACGDCSCEVGGGKRILLMDDEASICTVTAQMLAEIGYDVVCARDGAQALELFREARAQGRPFAFAIMDLMVRGGMGGVETVRQMRVIDPHLTAIVASGYSTDPVLAEPHRYGFNAGIQKPFTLDNLAATLERVVNNAAVVRTEAKDE